MKIPPHVCLLNHKDCWLPSSGEVQAVGHMPKHTPGHCPRGHVNQQLRSQGCQQPTPPQPPLVTVMVDNSCKRVMREDTSTCSDMVRRRARVHLFHGGNWKEFCSSLAPHLPQQFLLEQFMQRKQRCSPCVQADEPRYNASQLSHSTVPTNISQGKS